MWTSFTENVYKLCHDQTSCQCHSFTLPSTYYQTPEKLQTLPRDDVQTNSTYTDPLTNQVSNSTYCINDTSYSTIYCIL